MPSWDRPCQLLVAYLLCWFFCDHVSPAVGACRVQCCPKQKVNSLIALCDNPIHGLASQMSVKACEIVRSCVGGALTAIKEVVEVASEVRA